MPDSDMVRAAPGSKWLYFDRLRRAERAGRSSRSWERLLETARSEATEKLMESVHSRKTHIVNLAIRCPTYICLEPGYVPSAMLVEWRSTMRSVARQQVDRVHSATMTGLEDDLHSCSGLWHNHVDAAMLHEQPPARLARDKMRIPGTESWEIRQRYYPGD
ncbi:hypothetical protein M436DRAFT_61095 [Aureobasidium namibiae CBS 147.97]|uniref:Uncharacterized protein n=1 Tax=Aureobasidium namibiae CBS 147.97 TaxID=1043004 RepID=A0A074X152_9PEZI|nr:uncharacterized protein M436DRAFT_61095 [Aureobasidium namibiae CBS 147.97]KEQ75777.1 hypothetical protein M436DRAFT_61095 [Aureobasidium namibiae CBS 147.97]